MSDEDSNPLLTTATRAERKSWEAFFNERKKALHAARAKFQGDIWEYRKRHLHYWLGWLVAIIYATLCAFASIYAVGELGLSSGLAYAAGITTLVANIAMFWVCVPIMLYRLWNKDFSIYHETQRAQHDSDSHYIYLKTKQDNGTFKEVSAEKKWLIRIFTYIFAPISAFAVTALFVMGVPAAFETMGINIAVQSTSDVGWALLLAVFSAFSLVCNWALATHSAVNYLGRKDLSFSSIWKSIKGWRSNLKDNLKNSTARDHGQLALFAVFAGIGTFGLLSFYNAAASASINFIEYFASMGMFTETIGMGILIIGFIGYFPFATIAAYRGAGVISNLTADTWKATEKEVTHIYETFNKVLPAPAAGACTFFFSIVYLPITAIIVTLSHFVHLLAGANAIANGTLTATGAPGNSATSTALAGAGGAFGSGNTYASTQQSEDDTQGEKLPYTENGLVYIWDSKTSYATSTHAKTEEYTLPKASPG